MSNIIIVNKRTGEETYVPNVHRLTEKGFYTVVEDDNGTRVIVHAAYDIKSA